MIGTILNTAGILIGGAAGLIRSKPLPPATEGWARLAVSVLTVFYGLRLMWLSISGSPLQILKQFAIIILALMLGRITGRLLRLQQLSNRLGQQARERLSATPADKVARTSEGFKTCAALFCASPLSILGAVQDGLTSPPYFYPLAVKGVIDGLAALSFVRLFNWGVLLAALPVLAFQGTITLACERYLEPFLTLHSLADPINATGGLLVSCVGLLLLGLKKIQLADYLPSLFFAGLIAWFWR